MPAGTKRLVVVMTWDEPPASAGASRAVIYDIDLWVDRNVDCGDLTGACGDYVSVSTVDNVEYIVVHDPPPGTYRVEGRSRSMPRRVSVPGAMSAVVIRGDTTGPPVTAYMTAPSNPHGRAPSSE